MGNICGKFLKTICGNQEEQNKFIFTCSGDTSIMVRKKYESAWFKGNQIKVYQNQECLDQLQFFNKTFIIRCQLIHTKHLDDFSSLIIKRGEKYYWSVKCLQAKSPISSKDQDIIAYLNNSPLCADCFIKDLISDQDTLKKSLIKNPIQSFKKDTDKKSLFNQPNQSPQASLKSSKNSSPKNDSVASQIKVPINIFISDNKKRFFLCKQIPYNLSNQLIRLDGGDNRSNSLFNSFNPKLLYSQANTEDKQLQQYDQLKLLIEVWGVSCSPRYISNVIFSDKSQYMKLCAKKVFNRMLAFNNIQQLKKQTEQVVKYMINFFYPVDLLNFKHVIQETFLKAFAQFQLKAKYLLYNYIEKKVIIEQIEQEKKQKQKLFQQVYFEGEFDHFEDFNLMVQNSKYYTRTFVQVKKFQDDRQYQNVRKSKVRFNFNCFNFKSHFQLKNTEQAKQNIRVGKLCQCFFAIYFRKIREMELLKSNQNQESKFLKNKQLSQLQKKREQLKQKIKNTLDKQKPFYKINYESIPVLMQKIYFLFILSESPLKILLPPLTELVYQKTQNGNLQLFQLGNDICAQVPFVQEASFNHFYFKGIYQKFDQSEKINYAERGQIKLQNQDFQGAYQDFEKAQNQSFNKGNFKVSMYKAAFKEYLKVLTELSSIKEKLKKQMIVKYQRDIQQKLCANKQYRLERDPEAEQIRQEKQTFLNKISTQSTEDWNPDDFPDDLDSKKDFQSKNRIRLDLLDRLQKIYKETTVRSLELEICNHYINNYKYFLTSKIDTEIQEKIQNLAQEIYQLRQQYRSNQLNQQNHQELQMQRNRIERTISFKSIQQWNLIMFLTVSYCFKQTGTKHIDTFKKNFKYLNQTFFSLLSKSQQQTYEKWKKLVLKY